MKYNGICRSFNTKGADRHAYSVIAPKWELNSET